MWSVYWHNFYILILFANLMNCLDVLLSFMVIII
nr:MAG TPA: hypothetical protein [Crassvirales sp.]